MKTKFLFIFLLVIFSLSLVSSVEISMKNKVDLGENFVVKISGTFYQPLTKDNIKFYREGYMPTSMAPSNFTEINGDYFFFLNIPTEKVPDNYTLEIKNVKYYQGGNLVLGTLTKNFTITNNTVPFRIYPPFLVANNSMNISLENMLNDTIKVSTQKDTRTLESMNSTGQSVSSGSFLDVLFGKTNSTNSTNSTTNITQSTYYGTISINSGQTKSILYPAPLKAGFETINFYYDGQAYGLLAYFPQDSPLINNTNDTNNMTMNNTNSTYFNETNGTISNSTNSTNSTPSINSDAENCSALNISEGGGVVPACNATETCSGSNVITLSEKCCKGTCIPVKKSNSGKTVGWIIIGVLVLGGLWFMRKKYSKAAPSPSKLFSKRK